MRTGPVLGFILLFLRLQLAGLFGFAAYVKLTDPQSFAFSIKGFDILPDRLAVLSTFAVPWTELLCAVCLVLGVWTRAAAILLTALIVVFIGAIASALARGLNVSCGCFGAFELFCKGPLGGCNIAQNSVLLAETVLIAVFGYGRLGLDGFTPTVESNPART